MAVMPDKWIRGKAESFGMIEPSVDHNVEGQI